MKELRCTLLGVGSSDRAFIPLITWLLHQKLPQMPVRVEWADLFRLAQPPEGLAKKILAAVDFYPCDVLFVHRDAEREPRENRIVEIGNAIRDAELATPFVCVVPVRMKEAWLLIDEVAIRSAAGNPNGDVRLSLPKLQTIESTPDPKNELYALLRTASEFRGRRLKQFSTSASAFRVAELINDWSPLRKLPAFSACETELNLTLEKLPCYSS